MIRQFQLSPPGKGQGVSCDGDGAFIAAIPLLKRLGIDAKDAWHPRDCDELSEEVGEHYGLPIDMSSKRGGLKAIANALNEGDVARAQIATVLLGIPDPLPLSKGARSRDAMIKLIRDLDWSGLIKADWDPDKHPRWPAGSSSGKGGEFSPNEESGGTGVSPAPQSHAVDRTNPHGRQSDAAQRNARTQLADAARSDASDDPVAEAAARAVTATRHNVSPADSQAKPVDREHENFWQAFGSGLSHDVKTALARMGQAEIDNSYNNFAMATDQANALKAYADYRAQPWTTSDGRPIMVPNFVVGDRLHNQLAQMEHALVEPNAPAMRPGTNADWIDPLFDWVFTIISLGSASRLASPVASALDTSDVAAASATAAESANTFDQLSAAASRAASKVGPGSGRFHGIAIHSAFRREVDALDSPNFFTEQSYLNGIPVDYGTRGSVRLDVVEGSLENPATIYDLKTGGATLTPPRIREIQSHLPPTAGRVTVKEVRP